MTIKDKIYRFMDSKFKDGLFTLKASYIRDKADIGKNRMPIICEAMWTVWKGNNRGGKIIDLPRSRKSKIKTTLDAVRREQKHRDSLIGKSNNDLNNKVPVRYDNNGPLKNCSSLDWIQGSNLIIKYNEN